MLLVGCALGFAVAVPVSAADPEASDVVTQKFALRLTNPMTTPPAAEDAWLPVALPNSTVRPEGAVSQAVWYRVPFAHWPGPAAEPWAVYLPYLHGGGQIWLNGVEVARISQSTENLRIRWERPQLVQLPAHLLRVGGNELMVRAAPTPGDAALRFPRVDIGPLVALMPVYDRRSFWVRSMPQTTVVACLIVSAFVLFIWWRRPSEVLYGLFGLATAMWGIRTLTFVIEVVPVDRWHLWRVTYLAATGGFVVVMAFFALRFAGLRLRWPERALLAYWVIGPVWLLLQGPGAEALVNRLWTGGLIPIGVGIVAVSFWTVWRQRTWASAVMPAALLVAVLAGVHDYLTSWDVGALDRLLPGWSTHRVFLLHHAANLLLLAMGGLLTARFIQTLSSMEQLNESLESRVADRERALSENYTRMAALERENAASGERQLIMREIHDGLGSKLFTSLSRVERGDMDNAQIADSLRACIADMRLALDALAPEDHDFRTAMGDFLFRWQAELDAAGVRPAWTIDMPDDAAPVPPHTTLQVLRIAQEALTNVVKHARAGQVQVRLQQHDGTLQLDIEDDGGGIAGPPSGTGRGLLNMRARAQQLGGHLAVRRDAGGTCVSLCIPLTR